MPGVKKSEVEQRRKPLLSPDLRCPSQWFCLEVPPFSSDAPFFSSLLPWSASWQLSFTAPVLPKLVFLPLVSPIAIPSPVDHWTFFKIIGITSVPWFQGLPWFPITLREPKHLMSQKALHSQVSLYPCGFIPRMCSHTLLQFCGTTWNFLWPVFLLTLCFLPDSYLPFKIQTWHFPKKPP